MLGEGKSLACVNWGEVAMAAAGGCAGGMGAGKLAKLLQKWFGKGFSKGQAKIVLKSAQETYKGSTRVGHALSKHAGRKPEIWGKMTGSMKTWNDQAMKHMREIIRGPGKFTKVTDKGTTFIEKRLSDGRGIRLNQDYSFKGFID